MPKRNNPISSSVLLNKANLQQETPLQAPLQTDNSSSD